MIRILLGLLILAGTALIVNELCGWLGLIPRGILRLVAMRLPADLRQAVYKDEWLPELRRELREADGRPITRLVIGIKYAADMGRGAGKVGRELEGVRDNEPEVRHVQLSDTGAVVDRLDVYQDEYRDTYGAAPAGGLPITDRGIVISATGLRLIGTGTVSASATIQPDQEA